MPPQRRADRSTAIGEKGGGIFHRQLHRFIVIGLSSTLLDALLYRLLLTGLPISIAKGSSYLIGMTFSIGCNYRWTFGLDGMDGSRVTRSVIVYLLSLAMNVAVNRAGLVALGGVGHGAPVAFLLATGCSTLFNFVGLRSWAFRRS
jgi:putative flippase GtrA